MIKEVQKKIWQVTSGQDGPIVAIMGGTHGNERTGIEVVQKLVAEFEQGILALKSGTLYLALGNLRAIETNTRSTDPSRDLNRVFNDALFEKKSDDSPYEVVRAKELASVLRICNICIDLHASNKPSDPMLIVPQFTNTYRLVCEKLRAPYVVTDPHHVFFKQPMTIGDYVDSRGGVGIGYETGQAQDTKRVKEVFDEMLFVLEDQGMIKRKSIRDLVTVEQVVYELIDMIVFTQEGFDFAPGMGEYSFQHYKKNDVLGYVGNRPFTAKEDGVFVLPTPKAHWKLGDYIVMLARRAN